MDKENIKKQNNYHKSKMHFILSHAYITFLFAVVLGVVFDLIIPIKILPPNFFQPFGLFIIFLGTFFIYWAQSSSKIVSKKRDKEKTSFNFSYGPYKYLRHPTHFGLFIMTLGLAFIINSLFSVLFIIFAYIIIKSIFVKKEEKLLEERYGENYLNYKNKTKDWI